MEIQSEVEVTSIDSNLFLVDSPIAAANFARLYNMNLSLMVSLVIRQEPGN